MLKQFFDTAQLKDGKLRVGGTGEGLIHFAVTQDSVTVKDFVNAQGRSWEKEVEVPFEQGSLEAIGLAVTFNDAGRTPGFETFAWADTITITPAG